MERSESGATGFSRLSTIPWHTHNFLLPFPSLSLLPPLSLLNPPFPSPSLNKHANRTHAHSWDGEKEGRQAQAAMWIAGSRRWRISAAKSACASLPRKTISC